MSTITADPTMLLVLSQMKEVTEIKDADGNLVGVYTPKTLTEDDVRKMFDLDKARERLAREGHLGRPFKEIQKKFRALEAEEKLKKRGKKTSRTIKA